MSTTKKTAKKKLIQQTGKNILTDNIEIGMIAAIIHYNREEEIQEALKTTDRTSVFAFCGLVADAFYKTYQDVHDWDWYLFESGQVTEEVSDWEEFIIWFTNKCIKAINVPFAISFEAYKASKAAHILEVDGFFATSTVFICNRTGLWIEQILQSCYTVIGKKEKHGEFGECVAFLQKHYKPKY